MLQCVALALLHSELALTLINSARRHQDAIEHAAMPQPIAPMGCLLLLTYYVMYGSLVCSQQVS